MSGNHAEQTFVEAAYAGEGWFAESLPLQRRMIARLVARGVLEVTDERRYNAVRGKTERRAVLTVRHRAMLDTLYRLVENGHAVAVKNRDGLKCYFATEQGKAAFEGNDPIAALRTGGWGQA